MRILQIACLTGLVWADVREYPVLASSTNGTNMTNSSLASEIDCGRWNTTPPVYAAAAPVWLVILTYWSHSVYLKHVSAANDLHRMLLRVPLIEFGHCSLSIGYFSLCPWESDVSRLLATVWVVLTILREPVILFCLLMVAKGWCITRTVLTSHEITIACIIAALMYISIINMYAMALAEISAPLSAIPTLIMYTVMLINVMVAISTNLKILKAQLLALRRSSAGPRGVCETHGCGGLA